MSLTLRRFNDIELVQALQARGYVVRRVHEARRELKVEHLGDIPEGWQDAALEAIRASLTRDHLTFETVSTAADVDLHRAALRMF